MRGVEEKSDAEIQERDKYPQRIHLNLLLRRKISHPTYRNPHTYHQYRHIERCPMPLILILGITRQHLNYHLAYKYEKHSAHDIIPSKMMSIIPRINHSKSHSKDHDADAYEVNAKEERV